MKKTILLATFTLSSALAMTAGAAEDVNSFITKARVIESTPIIETVYEQKEVCHYKYVTTTTTESGGQRGSSDVGDKIIGGIVGGALGSTIGKGSGRDAAAGAGALLGSEVGAQDGELSEGELIGGIAGGIIGNQVGKGSGKTAATAAGVLLGAIVGDELQHGGARADHTAEVVETRKKVRVCDIEETPKKVITGYTVLFEYDDYRFSHVMPREPNRYIDINISVDVLEDHTSQR